MLGVIRSAAMAAAVLAGLAIPAMAQQEYYKGKELRIFVGYASGGGYDTYARVVAQHVGRHLPGNPAVVVQNMPGADGLALANHMGQKAPRDGTAIALTNRNLAVAPVLGIIDKASVQYDPSEFFWIANLNVDTSVLTVRKDAGITKLDELKTKEIVVGATGLTSNNAIYPHVINNLLDTKIKVVIGYPGTSHLVLAMERGEIQGNGGWAWSSLKVQRPQWVEKGEVVLLLQLGTERIAELPNVPLITDLARNEREKQALELVFAADAMGRPFFAPPKIPAEVGKLLRAGFDAMVKDKTFVEATQKAKLDVTYQDGARVEAMVKRLAASPADTAELAKKYMQPAKTKIEELPAEKKK